MFFQKWDFVQCLVLSLWHIWIDPLKIKHKSFPHTTLDVIVDTHSSHITKIFWLTFNSRIDLLEK